MYSFDGKAEFQHHYSSLQCHMILQKSFWFAAQETFIIIINVQNCRCLIFLYAWDIFSEFFDE